MKTLKSLTAVCLLLFAGIQTYAQEEGLLLRYNFENVSGTSVPDNTASDVTASLKNEAKVVEIGKYHVLDLGNGTGYLDLTEQAGTIFKELDTYTISMYYRVNEEATLSGAGFFLWTFSTSATCASTEGKYSAYRLNAQRFANTTGGYSNEKGIEIGGESAKGKWIHVLYTQNGSTGRLYLDGVQKGASSSMPANTANFTSSIPYVWIGRAPFSGDSYLKQTLVYDIRLYNKELTGAEISALATVTEDLDYEYRYGAAGDFTALKEAIQEAITFINEHGNEYPPAALAEYQDEINLAQNYVNDGRINQYTIDAQISTLNEALTKLKKTAGFKLDESGIGEKYDTNRGFRHPGALHTDADFARIKEQIRTNSKVLQAYNVLTSADYSQSNVVSYPVETIVRGGGVGENYINAARGATMAYQNALRWRIDGSEAHAQNAVKILNAWAATTKYIGGDSNYALAAGLYGYAFANAAELVRDYEGWPAEDFETFKRWMLDVWYPSCIGFLRGRNGTWENSANKPGAGHGDAGNRPGHYWSNWGLCNALAVMSIGILCDDVFIYNQGISFYKYDQVGSFKEQPDAVILNEGLTEYLGNLVPYVETDERGAYGKLGQMQESGRDQGHATMAAGLAVDICQIAWNQGDDLYSYMDNRLAAGLEYVAAYNNAGLEGTDLPWHTYKYVDCRTAWHNGWLMEGPNASGRGAARPYWGRVIGHYEGVKGIKMQYSEKALEQMGIDGGGTGSTSGGYDHMGYSVLTCTRDFASSEQVPTLLTPVIEYNGKTVAHNELGGLTNTYLSTAEPGLPAGTMVTLKPQLPKGATDTGKWLWNTGETSKDITFPADRSGVYRATYTNEKGVESEQVFTIAVTGDCQAGRLNGSITYNGKTVQQESLNVLYGSTVTLSVNGYGGWGSYEWENGSIASSITIPHITTSREISVVFTNQGGSKTKKTFHLNVLNIRPDFIFDGKTYTDSLVVVVNAGESVTLTPSPSEVQPFGTWEWDNGSNSQNLLLENLQASEEYTVSYTTASGTSSITYKVYVKDSKYRFIENGNYHILHIPTGTYLTKTNAITPVFTEKDAAESLSQTWYIGHEPEKSNHWIMSLPDSTSLNKQGEYLNRLYATFQFYGNIGSEVLSICRRGSGDKFWEVNKDGDINFEASAEPRDYPFLFIPAEDEETGMHQTPDISADIREIQYYSTDGIRLNRPQKGICIRRIIFNNGEVIQDKIISKP